MKLMPHLKKGLNIFIKESRVLILSFIILPMVFSFIYGNMQKNLIEGRNPSIDVIKTNFQYNEETQKGKILKEILAQEKVKDFVLDTKDEAKYTVILNDDFKEVEIRGNDDSSVQFIMLKNFVQSIVHNFNEYEIVQHRVNELKIGEVEKASLTNQILMAMGENNNTLKVNEKIIEGYKALSAYEYYSISIFSFTSMIMVIILSGNFYREIKGGIVKRTLSTPNRKNDYFLGFIINSFIISMIISSLYVIINRILGNAFLGNPLYLILIVIMQSFLCAAIVGLIIAFIKSENTTNIIMNLVLVFSGFFGGVFFPSESMDLAILKKVANFTPNSLILNAYKNLSLHEGLQSIANEIIAMAVISLVFLTISMIKINHKWEV